jgi:DNA-binding MarR family transcriptional regulator
MKPPSGVALLLAQLGAHASGRFAARLAELDLTPAHAGVLRIIGQNPGLSQQSVSERLGAAPSRVVKLVDELEDMGLVERRRSADDRRTYELSIATGAVHQMAAVRSAVSQHEAALVASLSTEERQTLVTLLRKVAEAQGLMPGGAPER